MISVVIPAYNEEKVIARCLDAFVNQEIKQDFEVIVVNNNSTDKTETIAKTYQNKLNMVVIQEKIQGRGAARAKGFTLAKGKIILSTDADTCVPINWIETLYSELLNKQIVAVSGTMKINDRSVFTNMLINWFQPFAMKMYRIFFGHYWLSGFNFGVKRNIYLKSGGFNPNINTQEDIELSFKISKLGKIKFMPNLPVLASGRRFKNGLIQGIFTYIKTFIEYFVFRNKHTLMVDIR